MGLPIDKPRCQCYNSTIKPENQKTRKPGVKGKVVMGKIGFTTTIPVEVVYAAGKEPVDLNNIFIGHFDPGSLLDSAERDGFPRSSCGWIKGIYSSLIEQSDIECIIGVVE